VGGYCGEDGNDYEASTRLVGCRRLFFECGERGESG
jgi:hypothetical protein